MVADENTCPNSSAPDMFFVPEKEFQVLKSKLTKGSCITDKEADVLVNWGGVKGSDTLIPVDMSGAGENLDDFDAALKKLGATKVVECFLKAHEHFESTKHSFSEEDCPTPMTVKEWRVENGEDDEEDDAVPAYTPDLAHVPKAAFEAIKVKLSKKQEPTKAEVDALVNWTAPDTEILMPVDMNGSDEDLDDFEEMLEKLGPKQVAECFVQAEKHLEKKRSLLPAKKLKLITIKVWKETLDSDNSEDEKAAEEEADDDEDSDEDDDGDDEPAAKKAKAD